MYVELNWIGTSVPLVGFYQEPKVVEDQLQKPTVVFLLGMIDVAEHAEDVSKLLEFIRTQNEKAKKADKGCIRFLRGVVGAPIECFDEIEFDCAYFVHAEMTAGSHFKSSLTSYVVDITDSVYFSFGIRAGLMTFPNGLEFKDTDLLKKYFPDRV